MGALQQIFAIQKEMVATDPSQAMVTPVQMYSTLNDFVAMNGLGDTDQYFMDPQSPQVSRWLSRRPRRPSRTSR